MSTSGGIANKICGKIQALTERPYSFACICQIPKVFRGENDSRGPYTPWRIAIGPYHAKNEDLRVMEDFKLRCLLMFLDTSPTIQECATRINVREARGYYAGFLEEEYDDDSFAAMLLIDGAFVVTFLSNLNGFAQNLHMKGSVLPERIQKEILRDLLLLENQIPFFILNELFDVSFKPHEAISSTFSDVAYTALKPLVPVDRDIWPTMEDVNALTNCCQVKHLVHLMHVLWAKTHNSETFATTTNTCIVYADSQVMLPSAMRSTQDDAQTSSSKTACTIDQQELSQPFNTVVELHEAGVQFMRIRSQVQPNLSKIHFDKFSGVLQMPRLTVDEFSESYFKNLMAFEQYYLNEFQVTNYVYFMDHLIDSPKDVQILEKCDLLSNWLESKENVTTLFNSITKHTVTGFHAQLRQESKDMKAYIARPWNKWKTKLRRDYFGTPWLIISFIAALILLLLTLAQTIASIKQTKW